MWNESHVVTNLFIHLSCVTQLAAYLHHSCRIKLLKSKGAALILCVYSRLLLLPCTLIYICLLWCLTLESANVMALTRACLFNKIIFFYILVSTNEWQSEGTKTLTIDTVTEKKRCALTPYRPSHPHKYIFTYDIYIHVYVVDTYKCVRVVYYFLCNWNNPINKTTAQSNLSTTKDSLFTCVWCV